MDVFCNVGRWKYYHPDVDQKPLGDIVVVEDGRSMNPKLAKEWGLKVVQTFPAPK